ncbi:MAG: RagB/SusD family nutrient uptake outer membrane protein [Bacteroidales bacterium]|nr:RagB/SusD family nutrient uptake outer membrane protein [Bacteroidales bacterium]
MKKIFYAAAIALLFVGCSLEETPKSKFDESEAYKSSTLVYVNTVASLYTKMYNRFHGADDNYNYMSEFTSDVLFLPGRQGDWVDGGKHQNAFMHRWDPSTDYLRSIWNNSYSDIALCNASLEKLEEIRALKSLDDATINGYVAEVRGIRAFYYMWLVDFFGRIPVVTSSQAGISDVQQLSRSAAYDFVKKEITEIIPDLASDKSQKLSSEYYARFTKAAGYAMLARLAINGAVFSQDSWTGGKFTGGIDKVEANVTNWGKADKFSVDGKTMNAWETVVYCQEQIAKEGYKLEANFAANFTNAGNENSNENILCCPMDDTVYRRSDTQVTRSLHYNHASTIGFSSWNGTAATVHALNVFDYKEDYNKDGDLADGTYECDDPRFALSFFYGSCSVNGVKVGSGVSADKWPEGYYLGYEARNDFSVEDYSDPWGLYVVKWAGVRIKKYEYDPTTNGQNYFNSDRVIFRYADMLLLAAEAQYRLGKTAEALALLNQVRDRVGVAPMTEINLQVILDEKLREEIWETMGRRGDLVRCGLYTEQNEDKFVGMKHAIVCADYIYDKDGYTNVFPIPVEVINQNPNLTQNAGY